MAPCKFPVVPAAQVCTLVQCSLPMVRAVRLTCVVEYFPLSPQRKFTHFRNVIVRNLIPNVGDTPVKFSFYRLLTGACCCGRFYPHEASALVGTIPHVPCCVGAEDEGHIVFQSECALGATNPSWMPMHSGERGARQKLHKLMSGHKLILRVFSVSDCLHEHRAECPSEPNRPCPLAMSHAKLALEQRADLREQFHLNLNLAENPLANVPVNTVLFQLSDGYYGTTDQWRLLVRVLVLAVCARVNAHRLRVGCVFSAR